MPLLQSAPDWCFLKPPLDPAAYYRGLRAIGFTAAEIVPPERLALAHAAGLRVLSLFGHDQSRGLNRPEDHPATFAALRSAFALAAQNHIPHVICFSGARHGAPDSAGIQHCITALRTLAPEAAAANVTLTLEVFNKFDHPGYQADSSAYAFEVVRAVNSPNVKVLFDIYHMHRMGEPVTEVILENLPHIAHLHIAGSPLRNFPAPPPTQQIDYATLVRRVHAAGYRGYWGHEYHPVKDSLTELAVSYALFASYVST